MRITLSFLAVAVVCGSLLLPAACPAAEEEFTPACLAALSDKKEDAARAIKTLRDAGPPGLEALISTYQSAIDRHRKNPAKTEPMWDRLSTALDAVAAQKDAWAAGLYWYTNLASAERAARASGKPILSLRLLGTLDTEFSCANSRFFRTVLYPDAAVGKTLREHYILHWQSHRPVPKLTIDFGDGRKIERTITGNSVHYILTPDGRVVDVIPGLYGPAAFLRALDNAGQLAKTAGQPNFSQRLSTYHAQRLAETQVSWNADLQTLSLSSVPIASLNPAAPYVGAQQPRPTAMAGARITTSKMAVESRPLVALSPDRQVLASRTDDATWAKLAALHAKDARLDASSRAVILEKAGNAVQANRLTGSKRIVEDPTLVMIRNFERSVAEDTVRNEYLFHTQIHEWFVQNQIPPSLDDLNEKVYAQFFLMPRSDPWLGLVPSGTYTALPADATAVAAPTPAR
jgi:hypothetical protein